MKSVPPPFFCISDTSNILPSCSKIIKKVDVRRFSCKTTSNPKAIFFLSVFSLKPFF